MSHVAVQTMNMAENVREYNICANSQLFNVYRTFKHAIYTTQGYKIHLRLHTHARTHTRTYTHIKHSLIA